MLTRDSLWFVQARRKHLDRHRRPACSNTQRRSATSKRGCRKTLFRVSKGRGFKSQCENVGSGKAAPPPALQKVHVSCLFFVRPRETFWTQLDRPTGRQGLCGKPVAFREAPEEFIFLLFFPFARWSRQG